MHIPVHVARNIFALMLLILLVGCDRQPEAPTNPELIRQLVGLSHEVGRLESQVSSLQSVIFFVVIGAAIGIIVVGFIAYQQAEPQPKTVTRTRTIKHVEPRYVVLIDRQTGEKRKVPFELLPKTTRQKLLEYDQ